MAMWMHFENAHLKWLEQQILCYTYFATMKKKNHLKKCFRGPHWLNIGSVRKNRWRYDLGFSSEISGCGVALVNVLDKIIIGETPLPSWGHCIIVGWYLLLPVWLSLQACLSLHWSSALGISWGTCAQRLPTGQYISCNCFSLGLKLDFIVGILINSLFY